MLLKMQRVIAAFLALSLSHGLANGLGDPSAVKDQITRSSIGTSVEVRLLDASRIRGALSQKDGNGFTLQVGRGSGSTERRVAFDSVKSLKIINSRHTSPVAWIAAGAVVAAVVIAVAILLKERSNE